MKGKRESQANDCANKECSKDELLLKLYLNSWARNKVGSHANESKAAKQMRPNVASLRVQSEYRFKTSPERR